MDQYGGFLKWCYPTNYVFSYKKWAFWGVWGVPPFKETPIWYFENFDGAYFGNVPLRQYFLFRIPINISRLSVSWTVMNLWLSRPKSWGQKIWKIFGTDCVKQRVRIKLSWQLAAWFPIIHCGCICIVGIMSAILHSMVDSMVDQFPAFSFKAAHSKFLRHGVDWEFRWAPISNIMLCITV